MNPAEQRELMIWGGIALAVVVGGWVWLSMIRGQQVADATGEASSLHQRYEQYYVAEGEPADVAKMHAREQATEQGRQVDSVVDRVVWPGTGRGVFPPEFAGVRFSDDINYANAQGLVSDVAERLKARGDSLGVTLPAEMPLLAAGQLSSTDLPIRQRQLAQCCCYATMVDLLMDAGVTEISMIDLDSGMWCDANNEFAIVTASTLVNCSYESADAVIRQLDNNRCGFLLHEMSLDYQDDGSFMFSLTVGLCVLKPESWELSERGAPAAASGRRNPGRRSR